MGRLFSGWARLKISGPKGTKIKFANHDRVGNIKAEAFEVNGVHKLGIYAKRNIEAGEEIFLNYNHDAVPNGHIPSFFLAKKRGSRKK